MKKILFFALLTFGMNVIITSFSEAQPPPPIILNVTFYLQEQYLGYTPITLYCDTICIELHDAANYSNIVYSICNLSQNTSGTVSTTVPGTYNGSYYITVKAKKYLETTSFAPVSFAGGNVNYNFTSAQSQAYGNNLVLVNGAYAIYAGDVTSPGYPNPGNTVQDGMIDIYDIYYVYDSYLNGDYSPLNCPNADVTGDGVVDLTDVYIVVNNYLQAIIRKTP